MLNSPEIRKDLDTYLDIVADYTSNTEKEITELLRNKVFLHDPFEEIHRKRKWFES